MHNWEFFYPRQEQTFISNCFEDDSQDSQAAQVPFWDAKVQIHSLHEKTKTEVNQLTQVHEAIWPLAQEDTVETSGTSLHKTELQSQKGTHRSSHAFLR